MTEQRLIPVEESLPPADKSRFYENSSSVRVLVVYDTGGFGIANYDHSLKMWSSEIEECLDAGCPPRPDSICCDSWVTHWMLLPKHPNLK